MAISKKEWTTVGKLTLVSIFIGGGILAFYGGREAVRYFKVLKLNEARIKILDDLKTSIKTAPSFTKKPLSDAEIEKLIASWNDDLMKLSPAAFTAFMNYFNVTIPLGRDSKLKDVWAYELKNSDDLQKRRVAVDKFITSTMTKDEQGKDKLITYYDKTDLMNKFDDFAKNL